MKLTKQQKLEFLASGGVLLLIAITKNGDCLIKSRSQEKVWHTSVVCISFELANAIIDKMCANHPFKFKKDE